MDISGVLQIVGHADFIAEILSVPMLPLLESGVKIRMHTGNGSMVSDMLLEGHCDLGISAHPVLDDRLKSELIYTSKLLPVAAPSTVKRILSAQDFGWSVMPEFLCQQQIAQSELMEIPSPVGTHEIHYYLIWLPSALRQVRVAHARQTLLTQLWS